MKKWKKISSQTVYANPWLQLKVDNVINPEGIKATYSVIERKPSVFIFPITDKNEIYLILIERYTTGEEGWEIPAGGVLEGESFISAAKRELMEETGLISKNLVIAGSFHTINSISSQMAYTVIAKDFNPSLTSLQQEEGINSIKKVNVKDLLQMIEKNEIKDGQSITAIMQALLFMKLIK